MLGVSAIVFGAILGYAGLRLLAEYRIAFFANPRALMTLDVLLQIANCGAPAYLAILSLLGGIAFIFGGVGIFVAETLHVFHRLGWL